MTYVSCECPRNILGTYRTLFLLLLLYRCVQLQRTPEGCVHLARRPESNLKKRIATLLGSTTNFYTQITSAIKHKISSPPVDLRPGSTKP